MTGVQTCALPISITTEELRGWIRSGDVKRHNLRLKKVELDNDGQRKEPLQVDDPELPQLSNPPPNAITGTGNDFGDRLRELGLKVMGGANARTKFPQVTDVPPYAELEPMTTRTKHARLVVFKQGTMTDKTLPTNFKRFLSNAYNATKDPEYATFIQRLVRQKLGKYVYTNGTIHGQMMRLSVIQAQRDKLDKLLGKRLIIPIYKSRKLKLQSVPNGIDERMPEFLAWLRIHFPINSPKEHFFTYDLRAIVESQANLYGLAKDGGPTSEFINSEFRTSMGPLPNSKFKLNRKSDNGLFTYQANKSKRGDNIERDLALARSLLEGMDGAYRDSGLTETLAGVQQWIKARPYLFVAMGKRKMEAVEVAKYWDKIRTVWVYSGFVSWPGNLMLGALETKARTSMVKNMQSLVMYGWNPFAHLNKFLEIMGQKATDPNGPGYHIAIYSDNIYIALRSPRGGGFVLISLDGVKMESQIRPSEAEAGGRHILQSAFPSGDVPAGWASYWAVLMPMIIEQTRTLIDSAEFNISAMGSGNSGTFFFNCIKMLWFVFTYQNMPANLANHKPPMQLEYVHTRRQGHMKERTTDGKRWKFRVQWL